MKQRTKQAIKARLTAVAMYFVQGVASLVVFGVLTLLMVEWATGCGESYVDIKGTTYTNECVHREIYKAIKGGR